MFGLDVPYTKGQSTVIGQATADGSGKCGDSFALQQMLTDLGFNVGVVDGQIGNNTLKAVHQFADAAGIPYAYPIKANVCQAIMNAWTAKMAVAPTPAAKPTLKLMTFSPNYLKFLKVAAKGGGSAAITDSSGSAGGASGGVGGWWTAQSTITKVAIVGGGVAVLGGVVYLATKKKATPNRRRRRTRR